MKQRQTLAAEQTDNAPRTGQRVSVVIVNHNGGDRVLRAAANCLACRQVRELLLVDNASSDGSLQLLTAGYQDHPRVRILANARNLGFSVANNQAMQMARGDTLLLLNPDCELAPDTLEPLLPLLEQPQVGMVGCRILNEDGSEQRGDRRNLPTPWSGLIKAAPLLGRLLPTEASRAIDLHQQPLPEQAIPVEAISGAFMLFRRAVGERLGGLDEGYFLHCEDLDWCARLRQAGLQILFAPNTTILHHQGSCSREQPLFVLWHKHRGMMRYNRKFFRGRHPWWLIQAINLSIALRLLLLAVLCALRSWPQARRTPPGPRTAAPPPTAMPVTALAAQLRDRTVLVTGAGGLIGKALVPLLAAAGVPLRLLCRDPDASALCFPGLPIDFRQGDLLRPESLHGIGEGIDTIIHLASYKPDPDDPDPEDHPDHDAVSRQGSDNLLRACGAGKHWVYASSVRAMGVGNRECEDEDSTARPANTYGQAKLAAEQSILATTATQGDSAIVIRFTPIYGPGANPSLDRLIALLQRGRVPRLPDLGGRRSMIHLEDVLQALLLAAGARGRRGLYLASDGQSYSLPGLQRWICQGLGRPLPGWPLPGPLLTWGARLGDSLRALGLPFPLDQTRLWRVFGSACYDASRLRRELGFRPSRNLYREMPAIVAQVHQRQRP